MIVISIHLFVQQNSDFMYSIIPRTESTILQFVSKSLYRVLLASYSMLRIIESIGLFAILEATSNQISVFNPILYKLYTYKAHLMVSSSKPIMNSLTHFKKKISLSYAILKKAIA